MKGFAIQPLPIAEQTQTEASATRKRLALAIAGALAWLMMVAGSASAQVVTLLHSFNDSLNGSSDLNHPYGALIADKAGNFYSTTLNGGASDYYGGVFELRPPATKGGVWKETVLYSFTGGVDGSMSNAGLVMDANGALYGTTTEGGTSDYGVVFQLVPPVVEGDPWTENVLYSFTNGNDGANPGDALVFDKSGNLYGTASRGGSGAGGTIFELNPPATSGGTWTYNVLYSFSSAKDSATGCEPEASLLPALSGSFYGTTIGCGNNNGGVAFELSPPTVSGGEWTYTVIHVFGFRNGTGDGSYPQANLIAGKGGVLYGATLMGGTSAEGTVYSLTPPVAKGGTWKESILLSFNGANGYNPIGPLTITANGTLYGTTADGNPALQGTIFKLTPPAVSGGTWTDTTLIIFTNAATSPSFPEASLSLIDGALYSTSALGGPNDDGTVFKFVP
jgi:hypothetical protein